MGGRGERGRGGLMIMMLKKMGVKGGDGGHYVAICGHLVTCTACPQSAGKAGLVSMLGQPFGGQPPSFGVRNDSIGCFLAAFQTSGVHQLTPNGSHWVRQPLGVNSDPQS